MTACKDDATRTPHYPQDDSPLCCCEYVDRHGNKSHVLGLLCACEEIDEAADKLLRGQGVGRDLMGEMLSEIDDRFRVPFPGGAWHIGLPGAVPWLLLPPLLLFGSISARFLLLAAIALLPSLFWWHRRSLRLRKRSPFLFSWMLASLAYESALYALVMPHNQSHAASAAFVVPLTLTLALVGVIKRADPTSATGIADAAGAAARTHRCGVSGARVPRYDHYCAWVDEPVGAANHRAYLLFVSSMLVTCVGGAAQMVHATVTRAGWSPSLAWHHNRSTILLSFGCYGFAVGAAVFALLAHQTILLCSGRTAYEARRAARGDAPPDGGASSTPPSSDPPPAVLLGPLATFWAQTAPLHVTVRAAWDGRRPPEADKDDPSA